MSRKPKEIYQFSGFRLDLTAHTLSYLGEERKLTPKRFKLLLLFVQSRGRVLEKKEIIKEIWPYFTISEDELENQSIYSALNECVSKVRAALSDDAREARFIETVPGVGYRFIAEVKRIEEPLAVPVVAVLPFKQMTAQQEGDEFLGLGLAFTIITKIRNIRGIIVRPGSSIIRYNNPNQDPLEAAAELEADYLVNGYIQHSGSRIRVTAEFLRVRDNVALCSEKYDEEYTEVLSVQDLIAERMALEVEREIGHKLTTEERKEIRKPYTSSKEAYLHYVEGRFYWSKFTTKSFAKAIECFSRAIAIDPRYARAYSGTSDVYTWRGIYNLMPPRDAFPHAKENALKALSFDDELASAHTSLAFVEMCNELNWSGAEDAFKRAITFNPHYTTSHLGYSLLLTGLGRTAEALEESTKALEVDPVSRILHVTRGITLFEGRRFNESLEHFERALEFDPLFDAGYFGSALVYSQLKKYDRALEAAQKAYDISHENLINLSLIAGVLAMQRRKTEAQKILKELIALSQERYISPFQLACVYVSLGQKKLAFDCLKKAVRVRDPWVILLNSDPRLDSIRDDPRFPDVLSEIKLP